MKKLFMAFVCLMTMVIFASCGSNSYKTSNLATNIEPIFTQYRNWASNDLVVEPFKNEMISFFKGATGKEFSSFYDGEVRFDEIIPTPEGHNNTTDSVAVRFKCSDLVFIENTKGGMDDLEVKFDIIGKMSKSDASKLDGNLKYHIDGKIFGFIDDVDVSRAILPSIEMGHILCSEIILK